MIRRRPPETKNDGSDPRGNKTKANSSSRSKADDAKTLLDEEDRQEGLAKELLKLTSSLKHNFSTAGSVIKEDNAALDVMQRIAAANKENLVRESGRLQHHAYQSCFNCVMIMTVVFVIWSFIAMIIIMRVFQKQNV